VSALHLDYPPENMQVSKKPLDIMGQRQGRTVGGLIMMNIHKDFHLTQSYSKERFGPAQPFSNTRYFLNHGFSRFSRQIKTWPVSRCLMFERQTPVSGNAGVSFRWKTG
jgi:hypothetical protein